MCESHQDTPRRMRAGPTKKALAKRSSTCTNELAQGTALLNLALKMTHRDWDKVCRWEILMRRGRRGSSSWYEAGEAGTYSVCDGDTEGCMRRHCVAKASCAVGRVLDAIDAGLAGVRQERATEVTLTVVHYALRRRQ